MAKDWGERAYHQLDEEIWVAMMKPKWVLKKLSRDLSDKWVKDTVVKFFPIPTPGIEPPTYFIKTSKKCTTVTDVDITDLDTFDLVDLRQAKRARITVYKIVQEKKRLAERLAKLINDFNKRLDRVAEFQKVEFKTLSNGDAEPKIVEANVSVHVRGLV